MSQFTSSRGDAHLGVAVGGDEHRPAQPLVAARAAARTRSWRRSRPRGEHAGGAQRRRPVGGQPRADPAADQRARRAPSPNPSSTPSGASAAGHGSGMNTCVQPHSAARPDRADRRARRRSASGSGRAHPQRDQLDERAPRRGRAGSAAVGSPSTGPTSSAISPRMREEEQRRAERGAAAEPDPRGDERDARGEHDQHRLEDHPELRARRSRTRPGTSRARAGTRPAARSGA